MIHIIVWYYDKTFVKASSFRLNSKPRMAKLYHSCGLYKLAENTLVLRTAVYMHNFLNSTFLISLVF